ncbi:unnamed protein product [Closterium sp. Yama58-4]|nr:unnamed protein product [Closterium sp. Yama58-4]
MALIRARCVVLFAFVATLVPMAFAASSLTFGAKLIGANEVPMNGFLTVAAGDTIGTGDMQLNIYTTNGVPTEVGYNVRLSKLQGMMPPIMTHVHRGSKGTNGPLVLNLPCVYWQISTTDWSCMGKLVVTEAVLPAVKGILANPNEFHGNIHTVKYVNGAVRGQLERR